MCQCEGGKTVSAAVNSRGVRPRQEMFYSADYKLPRKPGDGYSAGWRDHCAHVLAPGCQECCRQVYGAKYVVGRRSIWSPVFTNQTFTLCTGGWGEGGERGGGMR